MGIISTIGRKSLKVRLLIGSIYLVLTVGAVSMIYPFWLMISGTGKSCVDIAELKLIPSYLVDDGMYYRKTVASLFNERLNFAQNYYGIPIADFKKLDMPAEKKEKLVGEWCAFLKEEESKLPFYSYMTGHSASVISSNSRPENFRHYKDMLFKKYNGDIAAMNKEQGTEFSTWNGFWFEELSCENRRQIPNARIGINRNWFKFKAENCPEYHRAYLNLNGYYKGSFLYPQYTKDIANFNRENKSSYRSYDQVRLSRRYPAKQTERERRNWEFFAREIANIFWVRVDASENPQFQQMLKAKYHTIGSLNRIYGKEYKAFDQVKLLKEIPEPYYGAMVADYTGFLKGWVDPVTKKLYKASASAISFVSPDFLFQEYLQKKYKRIGALNKALGTGFGSFEEITPPQREYHFREIMAHKSHQRWEFATRNFITIIDYIGLQGRGIVNTMIYCVLAVLCALTFNPLAAYALSRFQLPSTYKILLFLMLTMAFPQMVTQIPNFLMMRELGLLNTFGALVLPGLANGYSIFLLKGFFDSLPKELYESAMLDGASEARIFLQITMSLSKPILAVIALNAFTHAYSNFMMALLICQDQKMWTLMPWLYQLQQSSCQAVIYSSLIIASIPTFLIFMLCQNVIMRGIVVPVEK